MTNTVECIHWLQTTVNKLTAYDAAGFYRNTMPASVITAAGGPVAFIDVMMAAEARPSW